MRRHVLFVCAGTLLIVVCTMTDAGRPHWRRFLFD